MVSTKIEGRLGRCPFERIQYVCLSQVTPLTNQAAVDKFGSLLFSHVRFPGGSTPRRHGMDHASVPRSATTRSSTPRDPSGGGTEPKEGKSGP